MIQIREGTNDDIENICRLLIDTWQNCYSDFMPQTFLEKLDLDRQIKRHQEYMRKKVQYFVIENEQKQILGFTSYGKSRFEDYDDDLELYTIYVDQREQGNSFGKKLLAEVFVNVSSKNSSILVSVFTANPFVNFYLKNGFIKIGEKLIEMGKFSLACGIYRKNL